MKKILLLFLAIAGMVSTASAKTIYLANNWGKGNPKIYLFNSGDDMKTSWDDREALVITGKLNSSTNYYKLNLESWTYFIISYDESNSDGNTQTHTLTAADYTDGTVYEFLWNNEWSADGDENGRKTELTAVSSTVYDYTLTITTADTWSNLYVWIWDSSKNSLAGVDWPGQAATAGQGNTYTFSYKSYESTLGGVLFNQGNGQPQTGDMTIAQGSNSYYISTVTSSKVSDSDNTHGLSVKTNAYGYATFANYTAVNLASGFAYYATDNNNGNATAHYLSGEIAANTAMLIKGTPNTTYAFAITTETGTDYSSTNAFKKGSDGTVATTDGSVYNYILNGDAFYQAAGKTVAWNKAYLQLSQAATSRALVFEGDETTAIKSVGITEKTNSSYYNLNGQRVVSPAKGLYIMNGRKFFAK